MSVRSCVALVAASLLGACAVTPPPAPEPPAIPTAWYAPPLAHQGEPADLARWWSRFNDPVLADWLARAQALSPSVAEARARVFDARAQLRGEQAAGAPQVAAVASAGRSGQVLGQPLATTLGAGVQASWALDVWGGAQAGVNAAQARQDAAGAGWHEARVLVASELAARYFGLRLCQRQLQVVRDDRDSRLSTARATAQSEVAGLTAPAVAALARASAADAASRYQQQAQSCEQQLKSLVALTGSTEPALRAQLAQAPALPAGPALEGLLGVDAVPAEVIRQRPDVFRAQRTLVAAAESVGVAQASLLPSLSLSGSLLRSRVSAAGADATFNSWSVGPFTLSLPLTGRGALQAGVDSAQARYDSAAVAYAATLRNAVAEVERALVALASLREQQASIATALAGYAQSFTGTEARYRVGFASLNELEEARRLKLNADSGAVALQQSRIQAWIDLYVALGGGFDAAQVSASPEPTDNASKNPS
jgi:NodT family efflux transporter outer membrane factor (OMF) lipoprotein